jgi:hypothetical protein
MDLLWIVNKFVENLYYMGCFGGSPFGEAAKNLGSSMIRGGRVAPKIIG